MKNPKLSIIDTHAHLNLDEFTDDCSEVVARASEAGVGKIVVVGTDIKTSEKAIALAEKYPSVYAAAGVHPHEAADFNKRDIKHLSDMAAHPKVVALGEMGLDFYRNYSPRDKQFQALEWQLELASEISLPVIIHTRQATQDMIEVLGNWINRPHTDPPGVIHCFSENKDAAGTFLEMGFYLAIGGYVSYPSNPIREVVKIIPQDRLLIETDCPFQTPQPHRGKRNEPAYTVFTVETISDILDIPAETLAQQTTENAGRLFKFK